MSDDKRITEVRLIVIALVNVNDESFAAALLAGTKLPSTSRIVASEIVSDLESLSYIESVVVCEM
jgi:hypothetical protein